MITCLIIHADMLRSSTFFQVEMFGECLTEELNSQCALLALGGIAGSATTGTPKASPEHGNHLLLNPKPNEGPSPKNDPLFLCTSYFLSNNQMVLKSLGLVIEHPSRGSFPRALVPHSRR